MHVLIIPPRRYMSEKEPLQGIFQYHQAHALVQAGLRVGVMAPTSRSLRLLSKGITGWPTGIEFENDQGISVYRFQGWAWTTERTPYLPFWHRLHIAKRLFVKYAAEQGLPDLVHAHNALYAGAIAEWLQRAYHIPYVLTEHSTMYARGLVRWWQIPLARRALRNARARIVVSPSLGEVLEARFGEEVWPWEWIPNILDGAFEKAPLQGERVRQPDGPFRFLNIANLVEAKNHAGLLEAFALYFRGLRGVELRIGGDGPLRGKLQAQAESLGIAEQVTFLGLLSRERVLAEMQGCDAFVLSSDYETFGVVLIEALACGKPVVATASGGPECIVDASNGLLVPPRDTAALGEAMTTIRHSISSYDSVAIRRDCLARYGQKAVVEKLLSVYKRVLTQGLSY